MPNDELAAEQFIRRHYTADHFSNQAAAERAYFHVLADALARGKALSRLAWKLHRARQRNRALLSSIDDTTRQLHEQTTRVNQLFHEVQEQRASVEQLHVLLAGYRALSSTVTVQP